MASTVSACRAERARKRLPVDSYGSLVVGKCRDLFCSRLSALKVQLGKQSLNLSPDAHVANLLGEVVDQNGNQHIALDLVFRSAGSFVRIGPKPFTKFVAHGAEAFESNVFSEFHN